jgi:hypothetical protein
MLRGRAARVCCRWFGGAIPEVADYRVVLEPEDTFIGTVNEDFAIESMAGDIFQLGNASWQITQVLSGTVRVRMRRARRRTFRSGSEKRRPAATSYPRQSRIYEREWIRDLPPSRRDQHRRRRVSPKPKSKAQHLTG